MFLIRTCMNDIQYVDVLQTDDYVHNAYREWMIAWICMKGNCLNDKECICNEEELLTPISSILTICKCKYDCISNEFHWLL